MSLLELADVVYHMGRRASMILREIERATGRFEYVPVYYLAKRLRIKPKRLESMAEWLVSKKLVKKKTTEYVGYKLTFRGLDALAIKGLARLGVITQVGPKIGVGKEGDIWVVYLDGKPRILKLFRAGRSSFKRIAYHRSYLLGRRRDWLSASKILAKHEFSALLLLHRGGVRVPRPIARNRHAIVMEYVEGRELFKVRLSEPLNVFRNIIREIGKALELGFVHGDLSEYNILVTQQGDIYIIDWPQYVTPNHPMAPELLERDLKQIVGFFARRYHLDPEALREIVKRELGEFGGKNQNEASFESSS